MEVIRTLQMRPLSRYLCLVVLPLVLLLHGCGQSGESADFMAAKASSQTTTSAPTNDTTPSKGCAAKGEDCRSSGCCSDPDLKCFEKDGYFASCRANCTPGIYDTDPAPFRYPWTCRLLKPKSQPAAEPIEQRSCAAEDHNCMSTPCCDGLTCFEKNSEWASCGRTCTPGIDLAEPPALQTPWSCKVLGVFASTPAPVIEVASHEVDSEVDVIETEGQPPVQRLSTSTATTTSSTTKLALPTWNQTHCRNSTIEEGLMWIEGLTGTVYAQGGGGEVLGDTLTLHHNSGYSLLSTCRAEWAPDEFIQLKLIGRTITFQVDLSQVGCACNLAFYLVGGPALDPEGTPSKGECDDSPYYCDANKVCGQWCTEIDIMEANNHVFQATPHKCDAPSSTGHYFNCDRNGCAENTRDMANAYGPGPGFTIDTLLPFNVSTAFPGHGSTLTGMVTTLRQGGREVVLSHYKCDAAYMAALGPSLAAGMSLRMTYWGDDAQTMGWMDKPPCGEQVCSGMNAGPGVIRGVSVWPPQEGSPTRSIPGVRPLAPPLPAWKNLEKPHVHRPSPKVQGGLPPGLLALFSLVSLIVGLYTGAVVVLWLVPGLRPRPVPRAGMSIGGLRPSGSETDLCQNAEASSRELLSATGQGKPGQAGELGLAVQAVHEMIRSPHRACLQCCREGDRASEPGQTVPPGGSQRPAPGAAADAGQVQGTAFEF